ncbi:hypothetical protein IF1G_05016 [Cordyceps javanica]|uniref:C6 finger domain-containing protein n=1 Tax=Cordyceps javanica TaxID=43265 RepID=A0A545V3Z3_9HYPO|nr:hypothetical protein IF1G_05016 [Cordyceps javanica]TQW07722.1 fungal specific transcription factor domain-containing protein [Cordyceps javanica]
MSLMHMTDLAIQCNTTSPARKQVTGYYRYTEDEIRHILSLPGLSQDTHFPIELKLAIVQITRLRVEASTGPSLAATFEIRVQDVFRRIAAINVDDWPGNSKYDPGFISPSNALIFQLAARLYGIMALPRRAVWEVLRETAGVGTWSEMLASRRRELMKILKRVYPTIKYYPSLKWPLIVAGVAATGGDDAVDDQTFIDQSLYRIWQNPLSDNDVFLCLDKLRKFWSSGKCAWEDCFDEATPS